jgi:hypothetical protein
MFTTTPVIERVLFIFFGFAVAVPALFFAYYTVRLLYINLAFEDAAAHRSGGMLIGAVAFPVAAIVLGSIGSLLFRRGIRGPKQK